MSETTSAAPAATTNTPAVSDTSSVSTDAVTSLTGETTHDIVKPTHDTPLTAKQVRELGAQDLDALVTVKIDGQSRKITLREAIDNHQLKSASHKKMSEADRLVKERETTWRQEEAKRQEWQKDPVKFFKDNNLDFETYAEQKLIERMEREAMSPQERERADRAKAEAAELEEYRRFKAEQELTAKERDAQTRAATIRQGIDTSFARALEAASMPRDVGTVQELVRIMHNAVSQGKNLTPEQGVALLKVRLQKQQEQLFNSFDENGIKGLPASFLEKVRKALLADATSSLAPTATSESTRPAKAASGNKQTQTPKKFATEAEWREHLAKR
jgi:hypothetical protein